MTKKAKIIGVPMDLGAGRRGVDMGPSAIRIAGLNQAIRWLGYEVTDAGNVHVHPPEAVVQTNMRARYLPEIAAASEELAEMVEAALEEGALPVILGGDHSIAIGSVAGVGSFYRKRAKRSASSGSTLTPTATRPKRLRQETFTGCRWPRCSDMGQRTDPRRGIRAKGSARTHGDHRRAQH